MFFVRAKFPPVFIGLAAALLLAACGGSGGGGGPQFQTRTLPNNQVQLDNVLGVQYPDLSAVEIDHAAASNNPAFPNQPPAQNAQKLGEYNIPNGGRVAVWIVPSSHPSYPSPSPTPSPGARAVKTPYGDFRVYVRVFLPTEFLNAAPQTPIVVVPPANANPQCASGWISVDNECRARNGCEGVKFFNHTSGKCECPPTEFFDRDGACETRISQCAPSEIFFADENLCKIPSIAVCEQLQQIFNPDRAACETPSTAACNAVGKIFNPYESVCVDDCGSRMSFIGGQCRACRMDQIVGACACAPGPAGDECRELDRALGSYSIRLHAAHSITLHDGARVLGGGVTVAIMEVGPLHWRETPLRPLSTHSELPDIPVFGYDPTQLEAYRVDVDDAAHGIAVAGIMAGKKDGLHLSGVAPEADYLYGRVRTSDRPGLYERVIENGAAVLNNSWTPQQFISALDFRAENEGGELDLAQTRANLRSYLRVAGMGREGMEVDALLGQSVRFPHPAERPVFVWSAGNNNGKRVTSAVNLTMHGGPLLTVGARVSATVLAVMPDLPRFFPQLTLNNLAVAAVNDIPHEAHAVVVVNGVTLRQAEIADFSNRCGAGSESYCLAAPGVAAYGYTPSDRAAFGADNFAAFVEDKFTTGHLGGFVLAPETESFRQRTRHLPAGYDTGRGTSYAAPMVSGALALMRQYFARATDCGMGDECGLGSHELVARILATADKRGVYANTEIYGAGLLDVENALTPQGGLRALSGRDVESGMAFSAAESVFHSPMALGDSMRRHLTASPLALFDAMGAPFPATADGMLAEKNPPSGVGAHLRKFQNAARSNGADDGLFTYQFGEADDEVDESGVGGWFALNGDGDSLFGGEFGLGVGMDFGGVFANPFVLRESPGVLAGAAVDGFGVAVFGESMTAADAARTRGIAAEYSLWRLADETGGLAGQLGFVGESDSILGGRGRGGFGGANARTMFWGARGFGEVGGGWSVRGAAYWGRTDSAPEGDGAFWHFGADDLRSASFALGAERVGILREGDWLGFSLGQPLRAEGGGMIFHRPTGRTRRGNLTYRRERWDASPSGRELELSGEYRRPWGGLEGGFMGVSAGVARDAGHRGDASARGRFLLSAERVF